MSPRYEITVWNNHTGDVETYRREADEMELRDLQDYYDDGIHQVVIDNEWESDDDD